MKNTGKVWQVDFPGGQITVGPTSGPSPYVSTWWLPAFTQELYWDFNSPPTPFTSSTYGNEYDTPECSSGIYGDGTITMPASEIYWLPGGELGGINDIFIYLHWYQSQWFLTVVCTGFTGLGITAGEVSAMAWAHYKSGETDCLFGDREGVFTLDEWTAVSNGVEGEPELDITKIVVDADRPFPSQITFRQVDYHGSSVEI